MDGCGFGLALGDFGGFTHGVEKFVGYVGSACVGRCVNFAAGFVAGREGIRFLQCGHEVVEQR